MEFDNIKEVISKVKEIDKNTIKEETRFIEDLHCDSIELFQIIMGIEDAFGFQIKNEELEDIKTVKDAIEKIKQEKSK